MTSERNSGPMKAVLRAGETTIRARFMWALVLVAGIALAVSGTLVAFLQDNHIQSTATESLERVRNRLRVLAEEGVNPNTNARFTTVSDVLRTYLARSVISPVEGEVGFEGSTLSWLAPTDVKLRPEKDPELLAAIDSDLVATESIIKTVKTKQHTYRVLVAPVLLKDQRGALVHVVDLDASAAELRQTMALYVAAAFLTVTLLIGPAWFAVGRLLRPIEELRKATESIDEHDLTTRVPVRGRDDLTSLAEAVNLMLDRVQRAVESQRGLLDDVSHELRTPITVVRGHLELVDIHDPSDVAQTRDLAIDELDRMGVLVKDLLLLAKASQSDFVSCSWSDVAELTDQVFEKSKALGERNWQLERVAFVRAYLDSVRITQAWLQLVANAVKYSDPGTPIIIGSKVKEDWVLMWVKDHGIGMAAEDIADIRKRFVRTGAAIRRTGGSGLGLSIVESIMDAHAGFLDIESELGKGSIFTLRIPLRPVRREQLFPSRTTT